MPADDATLEPVTAEDCPLLGDRTREERDGPRHFRKGVSGEERAMGCSPGPFRLTDLVPPTRMHRHRHHGVFTPNHKISPPSRR